MEARDENGQGFTMDEISDNFITILFAGYDTTSNSISSMFHFLLNGISEEELKMLKDEVTDPSVDLDTSDSDLLSLPCLDAFVKELLRVASPVASTFRKVTEDCELDGIPIKKGTILNVTLACHMQLEDGDKFRISRFMEGEQLDKKFPYDYVPFGAGPRMCLGFQLARLDIKIILAELLRNYDFSEGTKPMKHLTFPMDAFVPHVCLQPKKTAA
ncbi:hypothetical protein HDV05_002857 [Chytridiales sp. JEL 0842]|nr:hypothetical protein HDV05_002857 [Chytridiales sp. JEL 0842]